MQHLITTNFYFMYKINSMPILFHAKNIMHFNINPPTRKQREQSAMQKIDKLATLGLPQITGV